MRDDLGHTIDHVTLKIDYAIIEHFSKHLYGSPYKAVEELVSNSFDAFATKTYVYLPGRFTADQLLVWDDGASMDLDGLRKLWWIARSPKDVEDRIAQSVGGERRLMIGKFGIGKLASYAVGHRITHLARRNGHFLRVSVDYRDVPHIEDPNEDPKAVQSHDVPVIELTEAECQDFLSAFFREEPEAKSRLWGSESWTLAIIDNLKPEASLREGRLSWVIGNGMPLRPDFKVWVNDVEVTPKIEKDAFAIWDFSTSEVRQALSSDWVRAKKDGNVNGEYELLPASDQTGGIPAIRLPSLGLVKAEVRLFNHSLLEKRTEDSPRSWGFFILVRERLLNPDDAAFLLQPPSFGTFYRAQFVVRADGLDSDLLADRERLRASTPKTKELELLQTALYSAARIKIEDNEARVAYEERSESLLPITSREHFKEPLTALLLRQDQFAPDPFELSKAHIERVSLNEGVGIAAVQPDGALQVNVAHPLFKALQLRLGEGKKSQEALQIYDLFAISERLLEGYLYNVGISDDKIDKILEWRDGLFRSIAQRFPMVPIDQIIAEVRETSYKGDKEFEVALVKLFAAMGFVTTHDGVTGKKDALVLAPIGRNEYRFTVEAKGSIGPVVNDKAEISGAAAHRDAVHAKLALVVAREFRGFKGSKDPEGAAVLNECRATGGVSIATVAVLEELYSAIHRYSYPLDLILPVLAEVEPPEAKLARVQGLKDPTVGFDYHGVLEDIWQRQQKEAAGDLVPYRTVWQAGPNRWNTTDFGDFERRLAALPDLTNLIEVSTEKTVVRIRQSPEVVAAAIQRAVEAIRGEVVNDSEAIKAARTTN